VSRIRVLVIDDSAFARRVLRQVLSRSPQVEVVGTAHDGLDGLERVTELEPDVVTLDLVMPNLDGIGFLQALRSLPVRQQPRVVVVSMSGTGSDLAISALHEGAVEVVQKPTALANDRLYELGDELVRKVEAAAVAKLIRPLARAAPLPLPAAPIPTPRHGLLVIGASTGGPQAVTALLRALPKTFPVPIALVVHIPVGFSQSLAEHMDRDCEIDVCEASEGQPLRAGLAVVARAGVHLTFGHGADGVLRCLLTAPPGVGFHRPSLDVMFESAASVCPSPVLGVVLTGMGSDGLEGSRALRRHAGTVLTQGEASSVVYGMPRVVWEDGLAAAQAEIEDMPALVLRHL